MSQSMFESKSKDKEVAEYDYKNFTLRYWLEEPKSDIYRIKGLVLSKQSKILQRFSSECEYTPDNKSQVIKILTDRIEKDLKDYIDFETEQAAAIKDDMSRMQTKN